MNKGYKAILLAAQRSNENRNENRGEMRNEMRGRYEGEYRGGNERMEMGEYESRRGRGNRSEYESRRRNTTRNEYPQDEQMRMGGNEDEYESRYEARNDGYGMNYPREEYEPEDRFRDRRGREHYDNGRFAPMRNRYERSENEREPDMRRLPPIYERPESRYESRYIPEDNPLPRMGFDGNSPGMHHPNIWKSSSMEQGRSGGSTQEEPLTEEKAKKWLEQMQNEDGSKGPHWTLDQVKQVVKQKMLNLEPVEVFVAMNMIWSDYSPVAKKYNVNSTDFYLDMAKAFLEDKDAAPEKLKKYFEYVVK